MSPAQRGAASQLRRRHGRALHQRRDHLRRRAAVLLDYVAAERIELEQVAELIEGAAEVCRDAGVALIGGETAEMPDVYRDGRARLRRDLRRHRRARPLIDGSAIAAGDVVLGFPSAGVHANGFTLVRRVLEEEDYDGPDLLAPTRLYLDVVRGLRGRALAFAHVTGGGILGNLERVLPAGRSAEIDWDAWERPPSSTGSPATSRRTRCDASSTSASAGARSCARPSRATS